MIAMSSLLTVTPLYRLIVNLSSIGKYGPSGHCAISLDKDSTAWADFRQGDFAEKGVWSHLVYVSETRVATDAYENDNFIVEAAVTTGGVIITKNRADFQRGELKFPDLLVLSPQQYCDL